MISQILQTSAVNSNGPFPFRPLPNCRISAYPYAAPAGPPSLVSHMALFGCQERFRAENLPDNRHPGYDGLKEDSP